MKEAVSTANGINDYRRALYNSGLLRCYTGAPPANVAAAQTALTGILLATMTFAATAFGPSSNRVITANAITQDSSADNSGTVGYAVCLAADGITVLSLHSVGVGSGEAQFNTLSVAALQPFSCSSFTITQPDGN